MNIQELEHQTYIDNLKIAYRNVLSCGRHVVCVLNENEEEIDFAYTIGNSRESEKPFEVLCFTRGLDSRVGGVMCNLIADIVDANDELYDHVIANKIVDLPLLDDRGFKVGLRLCSGKIRDTALDKYAIQLTNTDLKPLVGPFELFQILIADEQGNYPGQDCCDPFIESIVPPEMHLV
jgi:hypothetical protein